MKYQVKVMDIEKMDEQREKWNSLVFAMKRPSIFCTWEWMHSWLKHYGHLYKLLPLVIEDENEIIGILPLATRTMVIEDGLLPVRTLTFWGNIELHADHLDIISSPEKAPACLETVISYLKEDYADWDMLHLSHIDNDSYLFNKLNDIANSNDTDFRKVSVAPYVDITKEHNGSIELFMQSLGRNRRHDVKRREKTLFRENGVTYGPPKCMDDATAITKLFSLHKLRADKKGLQTSFAGERLMAFHSEIAEVFSRKSWTWLRFLYSGHEPIAAIYCFAFAGRIFAYQSGYDPDWETKGVGSILLYKIIREAFEENAIEFDFLRGGEGYKHTWTKMSRDQLVFNVYNRTFRSTLFKHTYNARFALKRMVKRDAL